MCTCILLMEDSTGNIPVGEGEGSMETVGVPARLIRLGPKPALVELIGIKMLQSFSSSFFHTHTHCMHRQIRKETFREKIRKKTEAPPCTFLWEEYLLGTQHSSTGTRSVWHFN